MSTTVLSPLAVPFHPSTSDIIFNNGVPSLININGVGEIIFGISDDAIEELYPPTAEDVAEMETVELFVEIMAHLSILEDKEERARSDFGHIKKRWEKRREEGLRGRPKPAKTGFEPAHHVTSRIHEDKTSLVPFHSLHCGNFDNNIRANEVKKITAIPKRSKGLHGFSRIQQPRKRC